jgi:hypothetical protein
MRESRGFERRPDCTGFPRSPSSASARATALRCLARVPVVSLFRNRVLSAWARLLAPAGLAFTQRSKMLPRVDSCAVAIPPSDAERIRAHRLGADQLVSSRQLHLRRGCVRSEQDRLPPASGARALVSQSFEADESCVSVIPADGKLVGFCLFVRDELYLGWEHTGKSFSGTCQQSKKEKRTIEEDCPSSVLRLSVGDVGSSSGPYRGLRRRRMRLWRRTGDLPVTIPS